MEPFKFEYEKINQRFKFIHELPSFDHEQKYGTIFNSFVFGFDEEGAKPQSQDPRSSIATPSNRHD